MNRVMKRMMMIYKAEPVPVLGQQLQFYDTAGQRPFTTSTSTKNSEKRGNSNNNNNNSSTDKDMHNQKGDNDSSSSPSSPFSNQHSSKGNNNNSSNNSSSGSNSSSNWWIRLGWTLLGLVVLDQILQFKQEWEDRNKRQAIEDIIQYQANHSTTDTTSDWEAVLHAPTLFTCTLQHIEPSLDGTKMLLRDGKVNLLQVGDMVEIIQANIGPNQAYHLCRLMSPQSSKNNSSRPSTDTHNKVDDDTRPFVGWYPVQFLKKVE